MFASFQILMSILLPVIIAMQMEHVLIQMEVSLAPVMLDTMVMVSFVKVTIPLSIHCRICQVLLIKNVLL